MQWNRGNRDLRKKCHKGRNYLPCQAKCLYQLSVFYIWSQLYKPISTIKFTSSQHLFSLVVSTLRSALSRIRNNNQISNKKLRVRFRIKYSFRVRNCRKYFKGYNFSNRWWWQQIYTKFGHMFPFIEYKGWFSSSGSANILEGEIIGIQYDKPVLRYLLLIKNIYYYKHHFALCLNLFIYKLRVSPSCPISLVTPNNISDFSLSLSS